MMFSDHSSSCGPPSFLSVSGWSESTRFFDIRHGNSPHRQQDVNIHQKSFMSFVKLQIKSMFPFENVLMTKSVPARPIRVITYSQILLRLTALRFICL